MNFLQIAQIFLKYSNTYIKIFYLVDIFCKKFLKLALFWNVESVGRGTCPLIVTPAQTFFRTLHRIVLQAGSGRKVTDVLK
jgi:hypothetical protein